MTTGARIEDLLRRLAPQVLGVLVRRSGRFDAAEDAVQEALLAAAVKWPDDGVPEHPRAWLVTVASRRLTDELRSEQARRRREDTAAVQVPADETVAPAPDEAPLTEQEDDTLTLLFLCCHPALSPASQVALTLRAVGGLTTAEIAGAFLVPEATMAQRISRAKQRIKATGVSFRTPPEQERTERLAAVLHVLYLIFSEGYTATSGPELQRTELTREAIRLTRAVHALLPDDGEVAGLLALMLLTDARRPARTRPGRHAGAARRAGPRAVGPGVHRGGRRARVRRAGAGDARPVPAPGRDRRRARGGGARGGHGLAADPRAVPAARAPVAEPDGHAQPRGCRGDGGRPRPDSSCSRRSTATTGSRATTGSTRCAPTCTSSPATARPHAAAT